VVDSLAFLTAFFSLLFISIDLIFLRTTKPPSCFAYSVVKRLSGSGEVVSLYLTLWFRVHSAFYSHPLLVQQLNKKARALDFLTGLYTSLAGIVTLILMFYLSFGTNSFQSCTFGCIDVTQKEDTWWQYCLIAFTTSVLNALIMASMIYPLFRHRNRMREVNESEKTLFVIIRRAAIGAGICIAIDWSNFVYKLLRKDKVVFSRYLVYDTQFFILHCVLSFSFSDWKERLFPFVVWPKV